MNPCILLGVTSEMGKKKKIPRGKVVYNAWEEKYILSYILYLQIRMNIQYQQ